MLELARKLDAALERVRLLEAAEKGLLFFVAHALVEPTLTSVCSEPKGRTCNCVYWYVTG